MYFETHAHYDNEKFNEDRHELLSNLLNNGIDYIINVGADIESSRASLKLASKYNNIYAAVGVHPHYVENMTEEYITLLEDYAKDKNVVAIGEIGLDYYYEHSPREVQKFWFNRQLELCKKLNLPVIIHSRDAAQDTFDIIKTSNVNKGVIHCYSGEVTMAKEYIKLGFHIGVGGVITFSTAKKLIEVVKEIEMDNILLETDCPYLSPVPNRGSRNDSSNLKYITEKIAQIKNITPEKVSKTSYNNALSIFNII